MQNGNYGSIDVQHPHEETQPLVVGGSTATTATNNHNNNTTTTTKSSRQSSSSSRFVKPLLICVSVLFVIGCVVLVGQKHREQQMESSSSSSSSSSTDGGSSIRVPLSTAVDTSTTTTTTTTTEPETETDTSVISSTTTTAAIAEPPEKLLYSNTPRFYTDQLVDHFDTSKNAKTWTQRYYAKRVFFGGPGHPIFLVIGGEGANDVGMFYPFIETVMAKQFGAYILHPEHRFYGISQPIPDTDHNATVPELLQLLTPEQSMLDMLRLAQHYRKKLQCSMDKASKDYCPIITVGGSYPGFLAAMMRLLYPQHVDMAYASSAPMKLYSKDADQWGYYEILTEAAERASPGCAKAVKHTLTDMESILQNKKDFLKYAFEELNVCPGSVPAYIDSGTLFSQEMMQIIETTFADANMIGNYPPSNHTWFAQLCHVFQNDTAISTPEQIRNFWLNLEIQDRTRSCFAMDYQMSEGSKATISSADWSGLGPGRDGRMWDFQCCTSLTPEMGFSHNSMFPYRKWTYDWLTDHCNTRFGVVGDPYEMVNQHHFNDLVGQGASRIIFTNGGNDMWMAGSYTTNVSDSIIAILMPSGGHHSEVYARPDDLPDIKEGQNQIRTILAGWLQDIQHGKYE